MQKAFFLLVLSLQLTSIAICQNEYIDSLQQVVALNRQDDAEMKAVLLLATNYYRDDPSLAKSLLSKNIRLANSANNLDRLCSSYTLLLSLYQKEGHTDSAVWCVNRLKSIVEKAPDNSRVLGNYNQAMGLYYKKTGNYKTALPHLLAAAKYAEINTTNKASIAGQWLNVGNNYQDMGDYKNAMIYHLKALGLFEEAGNKMGESFCYNSICINYNSLKQYADALEYGEKSLALKKVLKDKKGIGNTLISLGEAYMGMGNKKEALLKYEEALQIARKEKLVIEEATSYFNMARIFEAQKRDSIAIVYFTKSKLLAIQLDNKQMTANADVELTALYKNTDSLKQTEKVLVTSLATFKETGSLNKEADNYKRLSDFYAARKQYDKAFENLNKFHAAKDSMTGLNVQVQLNKLEEQYNSVKKEKEIVSLKADSDLQKQKFQKQRLLMIGAAVIALLAILGIWLVMNRNQLKQKMKELELRNRIAADLHDEVGSSLSSVHMLSQMAAQEGSEIIQKDILSRISSNAKETMDKMGDIVWMIKPGESESGNLKQRMERFAYEICSSKNIAVSLQIDQLENEKCSMGQRKNMYLIFKEALNNAVKYSGTEKVEVVFLKDDKNLVLTVKDFGKGFDANLNQNGNGLSNMAARAKEMNGELNIRSVPNIGTIVELKMPV